MWSKLYHFLASEIWQIRLKDLGPLQAVGLSVLRIVLATSRNFLGDSCGLKAAGLTYYTLLALVPILGILFVFAGVLGAEDAVADYIAHQSPERQKVLEELSQLAQNFLKKTQDGWMGLVGLAFFFWATLRLLFHVEDTLNGIYRVERSRGLFVTVRDYIAVIFLGPSFVLLSGSWTLWFVARSEELEALTDYSAWASSIRFMTGLMPYLILWMIFALFYTFLPNRRVRFRHGLFAGISAGTVYQLTQWGYVHFQIGISRMSSVYGSFAALPLFLVWMQLSWYIILAGAELCSSLSRKVAQDPQYRD